MPLNCGNLHIRTQATDPTLSPNTITQIIVSTGLQIGIIPESTVSGLSPYTITIKNESNEILYESPSPQAQSGVGSYIYAIIPFASIPNIGDDISIKIYSNGTTCEFTTTYTVLDYSTPTTTTSTTSTTSSTTINTNGLLEKYIHIQPTSNAGGYLVGNTYYFKCSSNNVTDDVCLLEFQNNLDPSKILNSLPTGTSIAVCPPSLDWIMLDVLCVAYPTTSTTINGSTTTSTTTINSSTNFYASSATNITKTLAQTTGSLLNLTHFGTTPLRTYVDSTGYTRPIWAVYWDVPHNSFTTYNRKAWELGLAGLVYGGQVNPDPLRNGIDYKDDGYFTFTSAIPYLNRCHNQYNATDSTDPWTPKTLEQLYDTGTEIGQSNLLGGQDNINNKSQRCIVMSDIETGYENGSEKHRVFLIAGARKTRGYFVSLYSAPFQEFGYTEDLATGAKKTYNYPDNDGNYNSTALSKLNTDWKVETRTTLLSKSINNESLLDYDNLMPSTEQSFYFEMLAPQGSHYPLDNSGNYIDVNKFGTYSERTVLNPTALCGTNMEWQAWYCRYKLNNRRNLFMPKLLADKGSLLGRNEFSKNYNGLLVTDSLTEHSNQNIGRKYAFIFTLLGFINGVDLELWDRAVTSNAGGIDTYSGVLGAIQMLDSIGAISAYRELVPQFWNTEYSLDGGTTWLKTYAINWDTSMTDVLPVRISKSSNKVLLTAFRPEGVEPTDFIARCSIDGIMRYFHVTADDWETTSYAYRNTILPNIPTANKDYYCKMFNFSIS